MTVSIARRAATLAIIGTAAFLMAACSSVKLDDVDGAMEVVVEVLAPSHGMILRALYLRRAFTLVLTSTPFKLNTKKCCLLTQAI
jgi:hypothetical protein